MQVRFTAGTELGVGDSAAGPAQAQAFTHLIFQVQIRASKTLLYLRGGRAASQGRERGAWGGGREGATAKACLPQASAPAGQLEGAGGKSLRGLHPHAAVGHPGPEPALPVDGVLSRVLESDEANAGPVVGESVGDLGGRKGERKGRT